MFPVRFQLFHMISNDFNCFYCYQIQSQNRVGNGIKVLLKQKKSLTKLHSKYPELG